MGYRQDVRGAETAGECAQSQHTSDRCGDQSGGIEQNDFLEGIGTKESMLGSQTFPVDP